MCNGGFLVSKWTSKPQENNWWFEYTSAMLFIWACHHLCTDLQSTLPYRFHCEKKRLSWHALSCQIYPGAVQGSTWRSVRTKQIYFGQIEWINVNMFPVDVLVATHSTTKYLITHLFGWISTSSYLISLSSVTSNLVIKVCPFSVTLDENWFS